MVIVNKNIRLIINLIIKRYLFHPIILKFTSLLQCEVAEIWLANIEVLGVSNNVRIWTHVFRAMLRNPFLDVGIEANYWIWINFNLFSWVLYHSCFNWSIRSNELEFSFVYTWLHQNPVTVIYKYMTFLILLLFIHSCTIIFTAILVYNNGLIKFNLLIISFIFVITKWLNYVIFNFHVSLDLVLNWRNKALWCLKIWRIFDIFCGKID